MTTVTHLCTSRNAMINKLDVSNEDWTEIASSRSYRRSLVIFSTKVSKPIIVYATPNKSSNNPTLHIKVEPSNQPDR